MKAPRQPIAPGDHFVATVLGRENRVIDCSVQEIAGQRIVVRLSAAIAPDSSISIVFRDTLLLGEVLGTWRDGVSIFGAIELQQALRGLLELSSALESLNLYPHPTKRDVCYMGQQSSGRGTERARALAEAPRV